MDNQNLKLRVFSRLSISHAHSRAHIFRGEAAIGDTPKILRSATQGKGPIAPPLNDQQLPNHVHAFVAICARTGCCFFATAPHAVRPSRPSKCNQLVKPEPAKIR
jgi:hypothetical protein